MINEVYNIIKEAIITNVYDDEFDYLLSSPLRLNMQLPMIEPISIYSIMYYMGSLVRYHPNYIEKLLESRDGWIIERFVKSTPNTFLRYMVNIITKHDYVYIQR